MVITTRTGGVPPESVLEKQPCLYFLLTYYLIEFALVGVLVHNVGTSCSAGIVIGVAMFKWFGIGFACAIYPYLRSASSPIAALTASTGLFDS